jgi:hypothetical protein
MRFQQLAELLLGVIIEERAPLNGAALHVIAVGVPQPSRFERFSWVEFSLLYSFADSPISPIPSKPYPKRNQKFKTTPSIFDVWK